MGWVEVEAADEADARNKGYAELFDDYEQEREWDDEGELVTLPGSGPYRVVCVGDEPALLIDLPVRPSRRDSEKRASLSSIRRTAVLPFAAHEALLARSGPPCDRK